tara:strand:- start:476 stop:1591 length:1116 start_codon:yes stop_codon:yes gene_type:complete
MKRNAWQWFSNDLTFAEETLQQAQQLSKTAGQLASLCQHLTFFGRFQRAQTLLLNAEPEVLRQPHGRAALMRIRQYRHHTNPWLSLCLKEQRPWFEEVCERISKTSQPVQVHLGGGLGDMLETMAVLHNNKNLKQRMQYVIPDWAGKPLIPLLEKHQTTHHFDWTKASDFESILHREESIELPMMALKAALAKTKQDTIPQTVHSTDQCSYKKPTLLCCWKSKVDPDEKLWAHMRSMSMANIVRIYRELMPVAKQKGFHVVDITQYYDHEARELMNRHPSDLKLTAHTLRNFVDTTQYLGPNTLVASIDTSLIHLACWCGHRPLMLAHRWPDGRWLQGSWENIDILEQHTLFDWEPPIQRLIERIQNYNWE